MKTNFLAMAVLLLVLAAACKGAVETPVIAGVDSGGSGSSSGGSRASSGAPSSGTCSLPKLPGPCEAHIPSFWFNAANGKCEQFVYGGCEGNANRFESVEACIAECVDGPTEDPCSLVTCFEGSACVYQGATPVCAKPCGEAGTCEGEPTVTCKCAGSCPNCKDCRSVCLPEPQ